jgi:uncharacterized damage-inducible protein DinB
MAMSSAYAFLLDTYETEILKTTGIWAAFPPPAMDFRPHPKSRTVLEQMEHQVQSEGRWMRDMLGLDTGEFNPSERSQAAFIEKYGDDALRRLRLLRSRDDAWWRGEVMFFDVPRSRAWVMLRRINHSTHHRGQLVVYLRLAGGMVPSIYGPTADTGGKVAYQLPKSA